MNYRVGLILITAYCALSVCAAFPASGQEVCPPDPQVTLEPRWMVERVCACASLEPGSEACVCEQRRYIATIVRIFTEQAPTTPTPTDLPEATPTFVYPSRAPLPTPTQTPRSASMTPLPTRTRTPSPTGTATGRPIRGTVYIPRATKGRK